MTGLGHDLLFWLPLVIGPVMSTKRTSQLAAPFGEFMTWQGAR